MLALAQQQQRLQWRWPRRACGQLLRQLTARFATQAAMQEGGVTAAAASAAAALARAVEQLGILL